MVRSRKNTPPESTRAPDPEPDTMSYEHRLRSLRAHFVAKRDRAAVRVAELAADLANPLKRAAGVLEWSSGAFEAAAQLDALDDVIDQLKTETIRTVHAYALRTALHGARRPKMTTCPTDGFIALCKTAAYAEIEELMRHDAQCGLQEVRS